MSASEIFPEVLQFIGGVAAIGTTTVGLAYAAFRIFTTKWIDHRFSERLEAFKHQQNQEIEHLRFRINTLMDRTVKLHQREFDVLPETWSLLTEAFFTIEPIAIGLQQYPDIDRMTEDHLDEFLVQSPLTAVQKTEIKATPNKIEYYRIVKAGYDLNNAVEIYNHFHATLSKNGIFIMRELKRKFTEIDGMLKEAIIERQVQPTKFDRAMTLHSQGRQLLSALEQHVQARLWSSADTKAE